MIEICYSPPKTRQKRDGFGHFLASACKHPILTKEQEQELSKKVLKARYLDKLKAIHNCTSNIDLSWFINKSPKEIERIYHLGDWAHKELIRCNVKLVITIAKEYLHRGLDLEELQQEGIVGLSQATSRFDYSYGTRFSTYAVYWIRQGMIKATQEQSRTIRIPCYILSILNKAKAKARELSQKLGRSPSIKEVAAEIQVNPDKLQIYIQKTHKLTSLDNNYSNVEHEGKTSIVDLIIDPVSLNYLETQSDILEVKYYLEQLTDEERQIVEMKFGLGIFRDKPYTIKMIEKEYENTNIKVRAVYRNAMKKMRIMYNSTSEVSDTSMTETTKIKLKTLFQELNTIIAFQHTEEIMSNKAKRGEILQI